MTSNLIKRRGRKKNKYNPDIYQAAVLHTLALVKGPVHAPGGYTT